MDGVERGGAAVIAPTRPATKAQAQAELTAVGRQLRSADARGASYREVYLLVIRENALRSLLDQLAESG